MLNVVCVMLGISCAEKKCAAEKDIVLELKEAESHGLGDSKTAGNFPSPLIPAPLKTYLSHKPVPAKSSTATITTTNFIPQLAKKIIEHLLCARHFTRGCGCRKRD